MQIRAIGDAYKDYKKDKKYQNDICAIENCLTISNPDQEDADKDDIGNVCDNCMLYNSLQEDTDGDGKGDNVVVNGVLMDCVAN